MVDGSSTKTESWIKPSVNTGRCRYSKKSHQARTQRKEATKTYTVYSRCQEIHPAGLSDTLIVELSQDLLGSKGLGSADSWNDFFCETSAFSYMFEG
jgi:hypothetical protein